MYNLGGAGTGYLTIPSYPLPEIKITKLKMISTEPGLRTGTSFPRLKKILVKEGKR